MHDSLRLHRTTHNAGGTAGDASDIWVGWVGGAVAACADGCVADYTASAQIQCARMHYLLSGRSRLRVRSLTPRMLH